MNGKEFCFDRYRDTFAFLLIFSSVRSAVSIALGAENYYNTIYCMQDSVFAAIE